MPLVRRSPGTALKPKNEEELTSWEGTGVEVTPYISLLRLLAAVEDQAAKGINVYVTIGSTKKGDSLILSVIEGDDKQSVFGPALADLSMACSDLLMPF